MSYSLLHSAFPRDGVVPMMWLRSATQKGDRSLVMAVFATTPAGLPRNVSREVSRLLGWKVSTYGGVLVREQGRNLYYSVSSAIAEALHGDPAALTYLDVWDPDNTA